MSHQAERKEKDCLNCGTIVQGRFCHICGQENIVPKETFCGLATHFFYDITHFDSKFFDSLRLLVFKPGFLTREYSQGRRVRYLNPIRMYLFTSAFFFLVFFSIVHPEDTFKIDKGKPLTAEQRSEAIKGIQEELHSDSSNRVLKQKLELLADTTKEISAADLLQSKDLNVKVIQTHFSSVQQYDSAQKLLERNERDGWLRKTLIKKQLALNEKFRKSPEGTLKEFASVLLHKLPYLLFVSLPFFALILKLLYIRRRQFYYADHGIFTIHHYIFSFLLLLFIFTFDTLKGVTGWGIFSIFTAILILAWPLHLFIAMKRFYGQGIVKTFGKFTILNILAFMSVLLLFVIFLFFSVFQI